MAFNVFFLLYFGLRVSLGNSLGSRGHPHPHPPAASALAGRTKPSVSWGAADLRSDFQSVRALFLAQHFLKMC